MIKVESLKDQLYTAQDAAKAADDAWQAELDRLGIARYSKEAKGLAGSALRSLYDAKLAADAECRVLTDTMRQFQDVNQIQRP